MSCRFNPFIGGQVDTAALGQEPTRRKPSSLVLWSGVAMLLTASLLSAQARVQPPSPNYATIPGYNLSADGESVKSAAFHHSPGRGNVLIHDEENGIAFVVDSKQRQVSVFAADDFVRLGNGELEVVNGRSAKNVVPMRLIDRAPAFSIDGVQYKVVPKPPLLGPQTADQIIADDPHYGFAASQFLVQPNYLAQLKNVETPTRVLMFFGSWCRNCHQWLPNIIRLEQELEGSNIRFEYHGLPQGYADPVAREHDVRSVPYGIVFQNGEEVGRVAGPSWKFPSLALSRSLPRESAP